MKIYVKKENDKIIAYSETPQIGWQELEKDCSEIQEFLNPPPTYKDLRKQAYPNIADQLDMLYWDKINGTNNWQDLISSIKILYPKP